MFLNLQLLTDDTLDVDLETGIVSYTASDNVTRATSTALIRELIDNVDFKCTIVHYPENRTDYKTEFRNPDNYLSAEIGHDPSLVVKTWSYVEGEGFSMRNLPPEISLGHELIHVIRRMRGYERNQNDIGYYLGGPQPGQTLLRVNKPEELETSGIDYYKVIGGDWNNVVKVDSSQFDYTENKLRAEYDALHANDPGYILLGTRAAY